MKDLMDFFLLRLLRGSFCHLELRYLYFPSAQKIIQFLVDRPVFFILACFINVMVVSLFLNIVVLFFHDVSAFYN